MTRQQFVALRAQVDSAVRERLPASGGRFESPCAGCGVPVSDGYVLGCPVCVDRRDKRLRRGELLTSTAYAGEAIDNSDPRGRLIDRESAA